MIKLFNGSSLIQLNGKCKVHCYWFCIDRKHPVVPYQELIVGYNPNKDGIELNESGVNEFFAEQEIKLLENYLATRGLDLEIKKVEVIPVNTDYIGLGNSPSGGGAGFIRLNEHEGYTLPFKVWGYYDYNDPQDLVYSPEE